MICYTFQMSTTSTVLALGATASGGSTASVGSSASGATPASGGSTASGATPASGGSTASGATPSSGATSHSLERHETLYPEIMNSKKIGDSIRDNLPDGSELSTSFLQNITKLLEEPLRFSRMEFENKPKFDYDYPLVQIARMCILILDVKPELITSVIRMYYFLRATAKMTKRNSGEEMIYAWFSAKRVGHHDIVAERAAIGWQYSNEMVSCLIKTASKLNSAEVTQMVIQFLNELAKSHSQPDFCRNSCLTSILELATIALITETRPPHMVNLLWSISYMSEERESYLREQVKELV